MQRLSCLLVVGSVWFALAEFAAAQPALERLEQQVRKRSPARARESNEAASADKTGYLGVVADDRLDPGKGVRVVQVVRGSPAEQAGLKVDDLITAVAGKPVRSMEDMARILAPAPVDARLTFEIKRERKIQQLEVTLGRRPPEEERPFEDFGVIPDDVAPERLPSAPRAAWLGVRVEPVTPDVQAKLELPSTAGAVIVYVIPDSPAAKGGLPLEGVIVAVDDSEVRNTADLKRLIAAAGAGASVKISYYAQGELRESEVRLTTSAPAPPPLVGPWRLPPNMPGPNTPGPNLPGREPPDSDPEGRLDLLQQRVEQLEQRLAELERMLKRDAGEQEPSVPEEN